ncbi:hypothetical protein B0O99DRAFT_692223 [Bisporella sp. PMI_857]|nr:hypothetical protein B0O99DRAFT_692223 [Bisporella sp. PMI_857]
MTTPSASSPDFKIFRYTTSAAPIPALQLQLSSTWSYVGSPLNPFSLPQSYHTWTRGTFIPNTGSILDLLLPFLTFLHNFMAESHLTHYCLSIRAQKANHDFDIPRWHVDRRFFDADFPSSVSPNIDDGEKKKKNPFQRGKLEVEMKPSSWKLATALIGPGTRFLVDGQRGRELYSSISTSHKLLRQKKGHYAVGPDHVCTSFRCLGCADMAESVRHELAAAIDDERLETVDVGSGEVVVFRVDGYNACDGEPAMHSEPDMSRGDRVFVHVVPGREEELRRLVEGWGMEFPRDWCVGVLQDLEV